MDSAQYAYVVTIIWDSGFRWVKRNHSMYSSIRKLNLRNQTFVQFLESVREERSGKPLLIISACSPELGDLDTHWKLTWLSRAPGSLLTGSACQTKGRESQKMQPTTSGVYSTEADDAQGCTQTLLQNSHLLQPFFTVIVCFSLLLFIFCTSASPWQNTTWRYSEKGIMGVAILAYAQCRGHPQKGVTMMSRWQQMTYFVIILLSLQFFQVGIVFTFWMRKLPLREVTWFFSKLNLWQIWNPNSILPPLHHHPLDVVHILAIFGVIKRNESLIFPNSFLLWV